MRRAPIRQLRVLGLYPCTRGIAFGILEDGGRLLDWGLAVLYSKHPDELLLRVHGLVQQWQPNLVAIEGRATRARSAPAASRVQAVSEFVERLRLPQRLIEADDLAQCFPGCRRKFDRAMAVANAFPELQQHAIRPRRPWEGERDRMAVFCAIAITVAGCSRY